METQDHKALVRDEFTRQANAYAAAPVISDAEQLRKLVERSRRRGIARLEIATGPGYVAMALRKFAVRSLE